MRKIIAFTIIVLLCITGLAAMGSSDGQASITEDKTDTLRIFVPQSPGIPEGVTALAQAYMEAHPDKTITVRSVPFSQYKQQLTIMWSSDQVDDIVTFAPCETPSHVYNGCLLPLDDILPPEKQAEFLPAAIESATVDGHIYSYPFRESCSAMYYNKTYFEMAGIEAPPIDDPWTWEEWRENMLKIREVVKAQTGRDVWGLTFLTNPGQGDFWTTQIIRSAGERGSNTFKAIADDGVTLTGYADTPEAMDAYHFYQDLYTVDKLAPNAEVPDAFATGQSITMISFMATANIFNTQFPELEWGVMPLPYFVTPMTHTSGFAYSVSARTQCPNLAKDFVEFACSDEGIRIYFDVSGSDLLSKIGWAEKNPEYYAADYQKFFAENLEMYGETRPKTHAYTIYNQVMGFDMFVDLALGADVETTVRDSIARFERQAKSM